MNLGSEQVPEEHSFFHFHTNNIVNINSNNKTMSEPQKTLPALSWEELEALAPPPAERTQGPSNAQATLRLFGQEESCVRVVLFRDHHAWCPYCQKVWLWLEFKKIPYKIKKVTMRCYGKKEQWYTSLVPSGMLPALQLDDQLITESDNILIALEQTFGPLGTNMTNENIISLRKLERLLFRAWCSWLCSPRLSERGERERREGFQRVARKMEMVLERGGGEWLDGDGDVPGTVDVIFVPYVERMNASLAYFKGFLLRKEHPGIDKWLKNLEKLEIYRGTQSDFHTHAHDLPPQMGGCWANETKEQKKIVTLVDRGEGMGEMETKWEGEGGEGVSDEERALERVLRHRYTLMEKNPLGNEFDQPLRAALTTLMHQQQKQKQKQQKQQKQQQQHLPSQPTQGSAPSLRYLRDRISVPRDMPLHSARALRQALETTASLDQQQQQQQQQPQTTIPFDHRFDQDPRPFLA